MCLNLLINLMINQMNCFKHIIHSVFKWRVFRRFWIYLFMSFIIVLIQITLCITFYSLNNSSIESKIQNQINSNEKFRKTNSKSDLSLDYDFETNYPITDSFDSKSKHFTQNNRLKKIDFNIKSFCNISATNGKYGLSAIQRAVSRQCKQQLADITCLGLLNQLYPKELPRYCPLKDGNYGDYMGCYRDSAKPRILNGYKTKFSDNSPEKCLNICLQSGFTFAGLQFKSECFCGSKLPLISQKLEPTHCNMSCAGSHQHTCGGFYAIDIYKTGLKYSPKVMPTLVDNKVNEPSVRIVFLLTLNGRSFRQIKRLIKNIYDSKHFYYIHIDSRQDYLFRQLSQLETQLPNVRLSRNRLSTIWGGASLLQMLLNSISQVLKFTDWDHSWHFLINLSETDFPIKPLRELEVFLAANKGKNFVKSHGQDSQRFISKQGLDKTFVECDTHMWRVADRQLPHGIHWDGGSDWVILSRQFCNYVALEENDLLRGLKQIFKYTLLPAESFFHTVLQNSEFCSEIIDNNLRLTNWRRKQGCKCQYKHIVDWCGCSPNDFKANDWSRLVATQTKPLFFGRKFEPIISQKIINDLEKMINKNFSQVSRAVDRYWHNEYHHMDSEHSIDDSKLTFYYMIATNSQKSIENKCKIKISLNETNGAKPLHLSRVKEVNLYFKDDIFDGILVTFESISSTGTDSFLTLETLVHPFHNKTDNKVLGNLIDLEVCSEFDVKELVFRNFGCILGPFSKPIALHKWHSRADKLTATFVWVDPNDKIVATYDVKVESNGTSDQSFIVLSQKPKLNTPLKPGIWKLFVLHNWIVIAETKFLVSPLLFYNKTKLNKEFAKLINSGPKQNYPPINSSFIESIIRKDNQIYETKTNFEISDKSSDYLFNWINRLYSKFWYSSEICYISESTAFGLDFNCDLQISPCHLTDWSSYSPDPKSDLSHIR